MENVAGRSRWRDRFHRRGWYWHDLKHLFSDRCGGNDYPPNGGHQSFYVGDEVIAFVDDGGEIGLGHSNSWHHLYRAETFRKLALWYLWRWAAGEWFGLRRVIWFWLLHRVCETYKQEIPK